MDTNYLTKEEQEKRFNYRHSVSFIREEMRIREEIQILYRYLRKTVHNPYTEEQQEQFGKRIDELKEELYTIIEKPKWGVWNFHDFNKRELRHLNIAYRIIRGKEPIYPTKSEYSEDKIKDIVKKYSKDWYGSDKEEWKKLELAYHERIMKSIKAA